MFDWEDEELADILWGEADDHIVPYPEEGEKQPQPAFVQHENNEANEGPANSKPSEQKSAATKTKLHGRKLESNDDLSLLASNPDLNCIEKKTNPEEHPGISEDQNDDREIGDIIGNSWASIGSFEDLDSIFSTDELVDRASLDSPDELWTSSKNVIDSAAKSSSLALDSRTWGVGALGNSSGELNFDSEYPDNENVSYGSGYENAPESTCYTQQGSHSRFDQGEADFPPRSKLVMEQKVSNVAEKTMSESEDAAKKLASAGKSLKKDNWSISQSNHELKSENLSSRRQSSETYEAWPPPAVNLRRFNGQPFLGSPKNYPASVFGQQHVVQQSTCFSYGEFSNPYMGGYTRGIPSDQCTNMGALHARDDETQPVLSNAEACGNERVSGAKTADATIRLQNMTPQEKIEKLRRRQQMRAMLAIKKQQQQLNNPAPITDYSDAQKSSQEEQVHLERAGFESEENATSTYDPCALLKQDDCSAISVDVGGHNAEETVLYQLQDTVNKLDMNTRLCLRDSLFRLAHSAAQRHYASDSSSANGSGACEPTIVKESLSSEESFMGVTSAEAETNHVDRAVAHLLFHRPFMSSQKHGVTPKSSIPKIPPDSEMGTSSSFPLSFITKTSGNVSNISTHESAAPCPLKEPHDEGLHEQSQTDQRMEQENEEIKQTDEKV